MTIRVVARIRPQQQSELGKDVIVSSATICESLAQQTLVKIPNPRNEAQDYTFQFSSVYDKHSTQQQLFDHEVSPTIKHLFNGIDVTIFAYGSTGTGKTHTMRGGKSLAERGVIPRLLSGIYRRARKTDKESGGETTTEISLSYYEIYNDKIFDLFEAPEKRSIAGLPLRDNGSRTTVVGLTERPCESLKDFERLYDQANVNRSTSATKLNAASSRSHAILGIKVALTTGETVRISTASAIDLAGSEDNRRTENGKERMVESASINKSLFTLAKCVEAISQNQSRIPYRESKMTRILSVGQNKGLTIMILNLSPMRSYHLDTLSSLNFANRTKRIEVREIENEPVFKSCPKPVPSLTGTLIQRQPLRPLNSIVHNASNLSSKASNKQPKAFDVYADKGRTSSVAPRLPRADPVRHSSPLKRPSEPFISSASRPRKRRSPQRIARAQPADQAKMSKEAIEDIIEKKVSDILAARALNQPLFVPQPEITTEVRKRLELLEQKIDGQDDARAQGLEFLLMGKQHAVRGEDASALKMYILARDHFPDNVKLGSKIERLRGKFQNMQKHEDLRQKPLEVAAMSLIGQRSSDLDQPDDDDYEEPEEQELDDQNESDGGFHYKLKSKDAKKQKAIRTAVDEIDANGAQTPRTRKLLNIINTRNISRIRELKGVGVKKAEAIIGALDAAEGEGEYEVQVVQSLSQLGSLRGVGSKMLESMRNGLQASSAL